MKLARWLKIFVGIVGTLFLGAVGNGIWEYLLEPVLQISSSTVLSVVTFGSEIFKNSLYREVALGFREKASSELLAMTYWILIAIFLGTGFGLRERTLSILKRIRDRKAEVESISTALESHSFSGNESETPSSRDMGADANTAGKSLQERLETLLKEARLQELRSLRLVREINWMLFLASIVLASFLFGALRLSYVNERITKYEQLRRIISPFITSQENNLLSSRFARIRSENDYKKLMSNMMEIAKKEQVYIPGVNDN